MIQQRRFLKVRLLCLLAFLPVLHVYITYIQIVHRKSAEIWPFQYNTA